MDKRTKYLVVGLVAVIVILAIVIPSVLLSGNQPPKTPKKSLNDTDATKTTLAKDTEPTNTNLYQVKAQDEIKEIQKPKTQGACFCSGPADVLPCELGIV